MSITPAVGDRIRITGVMDDPDPIPVGTEGIVKSVNAIFNDGFQISVDWEIKRNLMLIEGDPFSIIG